MRILGLVGSARHLGNTEILVKEALLGAQTCGAEVAILRLTDLRIEPCNGCMACALKGVQCNLSDDLYFLIDQMERADGIVLGAPVYFMGAPGIIKMIVDRSLAVQPGRLDGKKAVTLGVAGQTQWARYFMPQINQLALILGFDLVGAAIFESPGPGEVLLNPSNPQRANELGQRLADSIKGVSRPISAEGRECPICRGTSFLLKSPTRVECPLCYTEGDIASVDGDVTIRFDPETLRFSYFGEASRQDHIEQWVKRTAAQFRKHIREVLAERRAYEDVPVPWVKPGGV